MRVLSLLVGIFVLPAVMMGQSTRTQIVMLGTGTPIPDPDRSGPGVAIVVDSVAYLFDAGTGVVRRASAAGRNGVGAFAPRGGSTQSSGQPSPRFDRVFLTHLHSDHTLGLADVIFTPWIQGRTVPLDIYGPPGTRRLVAGILDGNSEDILERTSASGGPSRDGWKAVVHEI
jgi:ribonuclease BN (tRNA processing enzyme)